MGSLTEEEYQKSVDLNSYRQSLQWLQQTCRPVLMKELSQISSVPVPITPSNAKHPSMIGGVQQVQVAIWKQCQVQVLPADRWGNPDDVLLEIQALHKLRKCRQIIQLYGYLPNSSQTSVQIPALLLQQPSYGSLRQFLDHHFDSIQWPERYKLALDMAQGLRFLISNDVPCTMHSGNVLVDNEGVAILTGFGIPGGLVTSAPCQMTAQPSPASLIVYMAPEKLQGKENYNPDWEVYSLGILLWELSSGRIPFDEIIARAESGPRLAKSMEQLSSAIIKGLREETVPGTPEIYEQLFKMCWEGEAESRPPLEVVEETLQMLVVVEPMDMLMLPGDDTGMSISTVVSDSIDADAISTHMRSNSIRSTSPGSSQVRSFTRPQTLHQAVSVSNPDMTEWYILSGHDINGYAIVPTYSLECEITPILTCLGHFLPNSLPILKELLDQEADITLLAKRSNQSCLHILLDRYIPFKNDSGSSHLFAALDMLLDAGAEPNAKDVQGYTPLHLLMKNPKIGTEDVVEAMNRMVAKGADTSIQAPRDGNVLALAAKYLHFEAVRTILDADMLASEPESIQQAVEACMTMTGRTTDKFVNLRTKTREFLKLWTGKAGAPRREKVAIKVLTDAGFLDSTGLRTKGKPGKIVVPQAQLDCANLYYDTHIKKKRELVLNNMGGVHGMILSI
ncbi:hypothetical protein BX616_009644 [Lobosporangium transversale]|uniref:Kinase-like domain-containing protein n=1 Tax=Lobosporangium transversale TaxID=64571 RepID=A0A1Y2GL95_9FUNG|nr:kinase-like domain-containing protein [Lobosporangium transversale]KAF9913751.1 hypothetical protein BX616_009644 [Lobosporangium transversale]ORZ14339.1 kinase-like domain-containing protein [Lobosporangium transversale]|eukprot:XP_021880817.1 kinase-like domain-containing protein [Lobosporangium transversale]